METGLVRKRVLHAIAASKGRAETRRQRSSEAEREYTAFLETVAAPIARQVAAALKAEGYSFTVFTPGDGVRLALDRGRDDFIEFSLDSSGDRPQVIGRVSRTRGSRRLEEERPIKADASPSEITDEDVLEFVVQAIEAWL